MTVSLEPFAQFLWGFQHDLELKLRHTLKMKTYFLFFSSSDSFRLITSRNMLTVWISRNISSHKFEFSTVIYRTFLSSNPPSLSHLISRSSNRLQPNLYLEWNNSVSMFTRALGYDGYEIAQLLNRWPAHKFRKWESSSTDYLIIND